MMVAKVCTFILFLILSACMQFLYAWMLTREKDDWYIIGVLIFLFNVLVPVIFFYISLIEKGIL